MPEIAFDSTIRNSLCRNQMKLYNQIIMVLSLSYDCNLEINIICAISNLETQIFQMCKDFLYYIICLNSYAISRDSKFTKTKELL